ncbi:MAG: hypothetical protein K2Q22_18020, partial [Cytophagales bacterium]|nr:hypothetical protein [Cytophagales bacterium]
IFASCFLIVFSGSSASFTGKKLDQLEFLINHGDYEEALRVGRLIAEKNKDVDTSTYIVTNCLLSKSAYHWYDFKLSDTYFSLAYDDWKNTNLSAKNKYMVGLYLTELALERNNPVHASEISKLLVSVKGVDFWYGHWFWILRAKIELALGNYSEAMNCVNASAGSLSNLRMEMGDHLEAEVEYRMLCLRSEILVESGNWEKATTTIQEIKELKRKEHLSGPENNFYEDRLIGLLEKAKSNYSKAHAAFLNAFNDLDANDYEYRKYAALKNAAFCASKAGMLTDVHQLMRRAEMLSMKDISSAHVFGPGQAVIRVNEFIESSQFEEAKSKSKSAQKRYDYLPEFHPARMEYLQLYSQSVEANGDLVEYRASLDTLAAALVRKYGSASFKLDEVKLKMAEYEWKYGGDFNASLGLYQQYYASRLSKNLFKYSPDHLRWLEGYAHVFENIDNYDSALVKVSLASEIADKSLGTNSPEANYFKSLTALHLFNTGKYKEAVDKLMSAYEANKKIMDNATGYLAKACYLQASLFEWIGEFALINKQIQKATQLMLAKEDNKYYEKVEGYEELGTALTSKNNFYRAEKSFINAIGTIRKKSGNESFMLIDPLLAAADLKIRKGDIKEAENYLTDAEKLIEKYFSPQSSRQAKYLELQSNYYQSVSDEKQAMELLGNSLTITSKLFGNKHVRLASILAERAQLYI